MQTMRHERLMQLLILGYSLKEAAQEMKIGYWAAKTTARHPEFILELKGKSEEICRRLQEEMVTNTFDMAKKLEESSAAALEEMMAMMNSLEGPSKLKVQICQDLLDRDPKSSRTKRMELGGTVSHEFISPALLIHAAATAKEIGKAIDVGTSTPNDPGHPEDSGNREG